MQAKRAFFFCYMAWDADWCRVGSLDSGVQLLVGVGSCDADYVNLGCRRSGGSRCIPRMFALVWCLS